MPTTPSSSFAAASFAANANATANVTTNATTTTNAATTTNPCMTDAEHLQALVIRARHGPAMQRVADDLAACARAFQRVERSLWADLDADMPLRVHHNHSYCRIMSSSFAFPAASSSSCSSGGCVGDRLPVETFDPPPLLLRCARRPPP
jgi:hypothetical protein